MSRTCPHCGKVIHSRKEELLELADELASKMLPKDHNQVCAILSELVQLPKYRNLRCSPQYIRRILPLKYRDLDKRNLNATK